MVRTSRSASGCGQARASAISAPWIRRRRHCEAPPRRHYDPDREVWEPKVHTVTLPAFFASVYEFTHGQWFLLTGDSSTTDFSDWKVEIGLDHPVCLIGQAELLHLVQAWGMRLPSGDEWEYLARGSSDDPRWCGREWRSLEHHENVSDKALNSRGRSDDGTYVPWDDAAVLTAPVGSYGANAFGIYDVLGNVCEICEYRRTGDRVDLRGKGGSWHLGARPARVTNTFSWDGSFKPSIGFRPVISIMD